MATILVISSHVARGSVGNSIVIFTLERMGHTVWSMPTTLLSNHPGEGVVTGGPLDADTFEAMFEGLAANGWLAQIDAMMTGYLPTPDLVAAAARMLAQVRNARPDAFYLCDPVLGDDEPGLYIEPAAAAGIAGELLPKSDLATPNRFELAWLGGAKEIKSPGAAGRQAAELGCPLVVATSIPDGEAALANVLVRGERAWFTSSSVRSGVANGTGDFFAALLLGHLLHGRSEVETLACAAGGLEAVVAAGAARSERLGVVALQDAWMSAPPLTVKEIEL